MLLPRSLFKAYDIRGVYDDTLTPASARLIGQAIGTAAVDRELKTLVVGRDGRLSSSTLATSLVSGVLSTGINVIDIGEVTTPMVSYAIQKLNTGAGVQITGSHNPPEYNGFKITMQNEPFYGEDLQSLADCINKLAFALGDGRYKKMNIEEEYINAVVDSIEPFPSVTIAIDCGNGIAGKYAPQIFEKLGCTVVPLYCDVDGHFPNHQPDPSRPENLATLIEAVTDGDAVLGFAFDGDGDRLGVVSKDGNIIYPDRLLMLFARDILKSNSGASIVYDVKSSSHLPRWIREHGGNPVMSRTGHSFMRAKMLELNAPLGGEMSGHLFFADRWPGFDDGIYEAARLLELLAKEPDPSAILNSLPQSCSTPEINVPMPEGEPFKVVEALQAHPEWFDGADNVSMIDGVRADYPDGFGLVRASNTTPIIVLRFEGDTPEAMARIRKTFDDALKKVAPEIDWENQKA